MTPFCLLALVASLAVGFTALHQQDWTAALLLGLPIGVFTWEVAG